MKGPTMSAQDKEYRAKDDARTLTDAEGIHSDAERLKGAHKHLKHAAKALHRAIGRIGGRKGSK